MSAPNDMTSSVAQMPEGRPLTEEAARKANFEVVSDLFRSTLFTYFDRSHNGVVDHTFSVNPDLVLQCLERLNTEGSSNHTGKDTWTDGEYDQQPPNSEDPSGSGRAAFLLQASDWAPVKEAVFGRFTDSNAGQRWEQCICVYTWVDEPRSADDTVWYSIAKMDRDRIAPYATNRFCATSDFYGVLPGVFFKELEKSLRPGTHPLRVKWKKSATSGWDGVKESTVAVPLHLGCLARQRSA